jgi:hypothetical protein
LPGGSRGLGDVYKRQRCISRFTFQSKRKLRENQLGKNY